MVGWMVGWLCGWLVVWLAGWLAGCLVRTLLPWTILPAVWFHVNVFDTVFLLPAASE
jgi:hypothetical protein